MSAEGLERAQRSRLIRTARTALGISQAEFAERFHVPLGTLQDWEHARVTAPDYAVAYVRVIIRDPDFVAATVA
ncbi:helix-turn-helix domain-containing protein [Jiella mangrovi]|uniref:helix-turn-helix domain-containing protein n=1 Tax=Jiella mangrovi TaxID=2821407 RepID=UPI0031582227